MYDLHDLWVLQDLPYFNIIVDCLHNWVILHFLLLLGLLFLCFFLLLIGQIVKVVPAQGAKLHQELFKLWIVAVLLHGLLRLRAHLSQYLHGCWVLKGRH